LAIDLSESVAETHMDNSIRHEVEWHAGKLELKAKVGLIEVQKRLVESACLDIEGPFDAERTGPGMWEIWWVRDLLKTITLGTATGGNDPRGIELFAVNATSNKVMLSKRFPHGGYPARRHLVIGVTESYSLTSSDLHTNITGI
jgi:hypothetical protein